MYGVMMMMTVLWCWGWCSGVWCYDDSDCAMELGMLFRCMVL